MRYCSPSPHLFLRVLVLFVCLVSPGVSAQTLSPDGSFAVDSFFDAFWEGGDLSDECRKCDALRREMNVQKTCIEEVTQEIDGIAMEIDAAEGIGMDDLVEQARAALDEFNNPDTFAESDGRRYDSADHAAMQRRSHDLWDAYRSGYLSAEDYSAEIAKDFDDPSIQEELDRIKDEIRRELEDTVKRLETLRDDLHEKMKENNERAAALTEELEDCTNALEALASDLTDCLERCQEEPINVPEDYDIGQDSGGGFWDWLFGAPDDTSTIPEIDALVESIALPDDDVIPIELVALDLVSSEPVLVTRGEIFLPPPCLACQPIIDAIQAKEAELKSAQQDLEAREARISAIESSLSLGESVIQGMEGALENLKNPKDVVESDGRRYDSADHAAMQQRTARLWDAYKDGTLSADELEAEWEKPFDDPEVQQELDAIKQQMIADLERSLQEVRDQMETMQENLAGEREEAARLRQEISDCQTALSVLQAQYDDCLKKCQLPHPPEDLYDPPTLGDNTESCPDDQYATKERCREGCGKGQCHRVLRQDCYQCVPEEPTSLVCGLPFFGDFLCGTEDIVEEPESGGETTVTSDGLEEGGFLCSTFGILCETDLPSPPLTLPDIIHCVDRGGPDCAWIDFNQDNVVNDADLSGLQFTLDGPGGIDIPLDIAGMDGDPGLTVGDIQPLRDCLSSGISCPGLTFTPPPGLITDPFESLDGLSGDDFGLRLDAPGTDTVLADPLSDRLVGIDGVAGLNGALPPIPGDFFGPGALDLFDPDGNRIGDPPPLPQSNEEDVVRRLIENVKERLREYTLGPCEKFVVTIFRTRIGDTVRYTARVTREFDEQACPSVCGNGVVERGEQCEVSADCFDDAVCDTCTCVPSILDPDDREEVPHGTPSEEDVYGDKDTPLVCPELAHPTEAACDRVCTQEGSECVSVDAISGPYGEDCYACLPKTLTACPDDAPYEEDSTCGGRCDGSVCGMKWVGHKRCYGCRFCPDAPVWHSMDLCENACSGVCTQSYKTVDGIGIDCYYCDQCKGDTYREDTCNELCRDGVCQETDDGCFACVPDEEDIVPPKEECDAPTMEEHVCRSSCDGTCSKIYTRNDGVKCYECLEEEGPICPSDAVSECGLCGLATECVEDDGCFFCQPVTDDTSACPSGEGDADTCAAQCPSDGVCLDEDGDGCFACVVVNCPSGTFKDTCPSDCVHGCDVVGEQSGVLCYQCAQSCEEVCSSSGFGTEDTDHSNAILSELNGYECVSGASISIQTATIDGCQCIGDYNLTIDHTMPQCDTPCGPLDCNSSMPCGENTTVFCNWGGWEKIEKHQFRPVFE